MPRDLNDLMESAVSSAPAEKYLAGDITRAAERAQRRRTTWVAVGAAAAVAVVAGVTVGLTQHHPTKPEPVGHLRYGQVTDVTAAVPVAQVPGFHELHYAVPPADSQPQTRREYRLKLPNPAFDVYADVDSSGRLVVEHRDEQPFGEALPVTPLVLPDTSSTASMATPPAAPVVSAPRTIPVSWLPGFVGDGRLLWLASGPIIKQSTPEMYVTDLAGSQSLPLVSDRNAPSPAIYPDRTWVVGDRVWFTSTKPPTHARITGKEGERFRLYRAPLSDPDQHTLVADDVVAASASNGTVGWVTGDGRGHLVSDGGTDVTSFDIPYDPGCTVSSFLSDNKGFAVTTGLIALDERCGLARAAVDQALVVDASGRLVLHVTGTSTYELVLTNGALAFGGINRGPVVFYRADLRTGVLAQLGQRATTNLDNLTVAGRYVLWQDESSYHVGEFTR